MSKYFNICNLYIFLWCLYSLQGVLYTSGSIISQSLLAILLVISVYYMVRANMEYVFPPYMKALNALVAMFIIYGLVLLFSGETFMVKDNLTIVSNKDYLKNICSSLLPIYSFFVFAKTGKLSQNTIVSWIPIFIVVAIASYFRVQHDNLVKAEEIMSMQEEFTNNAGYIFVAIVPLLLFIRKPIWQYLLLLVCGVFVIAAMKRGAMVIYAITLVLFFYWTLQGQSFAKKSLISIVILGGILVIIYFFMHMFDTSDYFYARFEQTIAGDASGREDIYPYLLRLIFYYTTPLQLMLGHGAYGTLKVSDNFAHNDWLEIGVNQGMLGVAVYLIYWIAFLKTAINLKHNRTIHHVLMLMILILFAKTMFSMSYEDIPVCLSLCIGYCMANYGTDMLNTRSNFV